MNKLALVALLVPLAIAACDDPAKNKPQATVSSVVAAPPPPPSTGVVTTYSIAPPSSKVEWTGSKVTGHHDGSFGTFSGAITFDGSIEKSTVSIDIDTTTITTTPDMLLTHLKSPDFFDVQKYPKAQFVSTSIKAGGADGATHTVTGNLDLHGVKKSITFPATITVVGDAIDATATFSINRKDFGINYAGKANDLIRDEVVMKLTIHGDKKKS